MSGRCFQEKALQSSFFQFYFVSTSWQLFSQEGRLENSSSLNPKFEF